VGKVNRCRLICLRHLRRSGVYSRIHIIRCYSHGATQQLPERLDFAFIDGDHSRSGIETDWRIVSERMRSQGVVCLHDSVVPPGEEWRRLDSCDYFESVIRCDPRFDTVEIVHSMAVVRRR
jgi:predicted O-methyltransferase YrrM